ncbi:carcinine hydrolase/isopenicillin-N N-acyltransferase family protein [uncultured Bacteroides sp.]|uniref:carcinine hydrolase/isopenicillin-N N-acyltransferase family protein n=1 Tax=uncultured Bacteroides sp. TaxID=162156 RepID=UPI002601EE5C|nr:carcinine hydrolase/isopenicillin-N N-acyltransferase family protein [uncultured Bacteroides sp.]
MKKRALLFVLCALTAAFGCLNPAAACTSAVVSGKVTPDGRPLLWKNRDTDYLRNHVAYVKGEKYDFIADVNSDNFPGLKEAWIGTNSAGFALMNTQSYNLVDVKEGEERGAANGRIIYRALEVCATVEEFRHFLDTIAKPSLIEANFGVIDARGGAAMFEVDYHRYVMYDANDPKDAPHGYIARTNFSLTGEVNQGAGYVRYMEAEQVLMKASATGGITPQGIFNDLSRSFHNCMLDIDLKSGDYNRPKASGWFVDQDFISRNSTSCSVVVQGVKPGENAELTTMWALLGYPPTGVALPLWVKDASRLLPSMVCFSKADAAAPLSASSLRLADRVFCYHQGMGTDRYLNWERLYSPSKGDGYMTRLAPVEAEVFRRTMLLLEGWRAQGGIDVKEMQRLYQELAEPIMSAYKQLVEEGW